MRTWWGARIGDCQRRVVIPTWVLRMVPEEECYPQHEVTPGCAAVSQACCSCLQPSLLTHFKETFTRTSLCPIFSSSQANLSPPAARGKKYIWMVDRVWTLWSCRTNPTRLYGPTVCIYIISRNGERNNISILINWERKQSLGQFTSPFCLTFCTYLYTLV